MNIYEKLIAIQTELKAPKGQYNEFGNYNYRSCEDILEALKPILSKYAATVFITDELRLIGERYYIEATAYLIDCEKSEQIYTKAFAREDASKKGMDGSQITGASSSYARKYALNGLFAIDDNKDSDDLNKHDEDEKDENKNGDDKNPDGKKKPKEKTPRELLIAKLNEKGIDVNEYAKEKGLNNKTTPERFTELLKEFEE